MFDLDQGRSAGSLLGWGRRTLLASRASGAIMTNVTLEPPPTQTLLDVRGLAPPQPMQRALQALALLPPQATLVVHTHHEPFPLYEMIDADNWRRSGRQLAPGHWEILIWRPEDAF
jgi:hypothetical protein